MFGQVLPPFAKSADLNNGLAPIESSIWNINYFSFQKDIRSKTSTLFLFP